MKFYVTTLLAVLRIPAVSAFVVQPRLSLVSSCVANIKQSNNTPMQMAGDLDGEFDKAFEDDFYSDYDPSKYESSDSNSNSNSEYGYDDAPRRPVRPSRGTGQGGGRGGRGGRGGGRGGRGRGGGRPGKTDLGPNGHDYQMSADTGENNSKLSESSIHSLLAERLQAKFSRDFRTADDIQMELIDAGVFVHDGLKEWRYDGMPYGSFHGGQGGERKVRDQQYSKSEHSTEVEGASDELITKLVKERTKFKMMREYSKADAVREGLRVKFNVMIDDRLKQWSTGGDFGEEHNAQRALAAGFANRGYIKSASSLSLDEEEEEYIQHHVEARTQAKKDRNFDSADKIRLDLAQRFDVVINDKMKLWSIGGVIEELGEKAGKPRGVYTRRGGGDLSDEQVDAISKMISDRYHAKKQRNFDAADEMRDTLYSQYSVKIDDRSNEWRVDTDEYAMAGTNSLSEEETKFIDNQLRARFNFKRVNQYEDADAIRDGLREKFGVQVDDRTKEWFIDAQLGAATSYVENEEIVGEEEIVEEEEVVEEEEIVEEDVALVA